MTPLSCSLSSAQRGVRRSETTSKGRRSARPAAATVIRHHPADPNLRHAGDRRDDGCWAGWNVASTRHRRDERAPFWPASGRRSPRSWSRRCCGWHSTRFAAAGRIGSLQPGQSDHPTPDPPPATGSARVRERADQDAHLGHDRADAGARQGLDSGAAQRSSFNRSDQQASDRPRGYRRDARADDGLVLARLTCAAYPRVSRRHELVTAARGLNPGTDQRSSGAAPPTLLVRCAAGHCRCGSEVAGCSPAAPALCCRGRVRPSGSLGFGVQRPPA